MAAKPSVNPIQLAALQRELGYHFQNEALLLQALRHKSAGGDHNERFEFLGDSVIGYIAAKLLFHTYPNYTEGELTRLRATVVRGESLAEIGNTLGLSEILIMGPSELKGGGFRRDSTLADTFEALMAAILLDSDLATCETVVTKLFMPLIKKLPCAEALKDPKSRLQEYWQSRQEEPPKYELLASEGPDHARVFTVKCLHGKHHSTADGSSRRKAEQAAAAIMLEQLGV